MLISRNTKILAATLLALGLAACTTKKADVPGQGSATEQSPDGGAGANASAGSTGGGLDSQALGGAGGTDGSGGTASPASLLGTRVFHFDYDSANIQDADYNSLKAHAAYLRKTPNARVLVGGHTDERGTREYNMALGERRAKTVAAFLTSNGANPGQLEVVSYGEEKPIAMGDSESVWSENRRVELDYTTAKP